MLRNLQTKNVPTPFFLCVCVEKITFFHSNNISREIKKGKGIVVTKKKRFWGNFQLKNVPTMFL